MTSHGSERVGGVSHERHPSTRGDPLGSASRSPDQASARVRRERCLHENGGRIGDGGPGGRAKLRPPGEREEFALAPAARAVEPMRVAGAEEPPWDTPPTRDSCGTMKCTGSLSGLSGPFGGFGRSGHSRVPVEARAWRTKGNGADPKARPVWKRSPWGAYFFFPSGATTAGGGSSTGAIPSFSRILFSISRATSGLSRSQAFEFSRPWPIRRSP